MDLTDIIETDQYLDACGNYYTTDQERMLKKPRMVVFGKDKVQAYDILGEKIPELCGDYTPELKALIAAASDEKTQYEDADDNR